MAVNFASSSAGTSILFGGDAIYDPISGLYFHSNGRQSISFRFTIADDQGHGSTSDPISLHKYLYANGDAVNIWDPSGHDGELPSLLTTISTIARVGIGVGFGVSGAWNLALASMDIQHMYTTATSGYGSRMEIVGETALFIFHTYTGLKNIQTGVALLFGTPTPPIPPAGLAVISAAFAAAGENPILLGITINGLSPAVAGAIINIAGVISASSSLTGQVFHQLGIGAGGGWTDANHLLIPKYLGGAENGPLQDLPGDLHAELHRELDDALSDEFAGEGAPAGRNTEAWRDFFRRVPGAQDRAWRVAQEVTEAFLKEHGIW